MRQDGVGPAGSWQRPVLQSGIKPYDRPAHASGTETSAGSVRESPLSREERGGDVDCLAVVRYGAHGKMDQGSTGYADSRTTKGYDRRATQLELSEIVRFKYCMTQ